MDEQRPQGKSMRELRRIVAADNARFEKIAEAWNSLTDEEQERLVGLAEAMARGETVLNDRDRATSDALAQDPRFR